MRFNVPTDKKNINVKYRVHIYIHLHDAIYIKFIGGISSESCRYGRLDIYKIVKEMKTNSYIYIYISPFGFPISENTSKFSVFNRYPNQGNSIISFIREL